MVSKLAENLYTFPIILPNSPLKWLNSYVIRGGERDLLIDTGFNRPECRSELMQNIAELGLKPERTDVFLTHMHADHSGNAAALQELGMKIYISDADYRYYGDVSRWDSQARMGKDGGMPESVIEEAVYHSPTRAFISPPYEATTLSDGDVLQYGAFRLECISTPGHTPGHMCLYDRESKTMFLGDHVLFDITPNICSLGRSADSLGTYLSSLERIRSYDIALALPGHRGQGMITVRERADDLQAHHRERMAEAERIIRENPGISAYDAAGLMQWNIRAKNWAEFPNGQKWFAFGEALAHLDRLYAEGRITVTPDDAGIDRYVALK